MSISILDLKVRLESKIHSSTLNKISDVYNLIYEAGANVLGEIDPRETLRITPITNAIYDQVYSYVAPTDLKGNKIKDIRPQANRKVSDNFSQTSGEQFDLYKSNQSFTIEDNSLVRTVRISKDLSPGQTINDATTLTENGTWAAGGNAINLAADTLNKISGSASLKFDISASGSTAYLENSTMAALDLTDYVNVGSIFVWVYIPSTSIITSVNLRWGSDSSNYYHQTVTASHDNTSFVVGWNLLRFDWSASTLVGTSINTAIDYLRVTFAYSGTATTSCRVDSVVIKTGTIYEMVYYSKYLFRSSAGTWKEIPTSDSDLINLDTDGINVLLYELQELAIQELQGDSMNADLNYIAEKKKAVWNAYKANHKSEAIKPQSSYYRMK